MAAQRFLAEVIANQAKQSIEAFAHVRGFHAHIDLRRGPRPNIKPFPPLGSGAPDRFRRTSIRSLCAGHCRAPAGIRQPAQDRALLSHERIVAALLCVDESNGPACSWRCRLPGKILVASYHFVGTARPMLLLLPVFDVSSRNHLRRRMFRTTGIAQTLTLNLRAHWYSHLYRRLNGKSALNAGSLALDLRGWRNLQYLPEETVVLRIVAIGLMIIRGLGRWCSVPIPQVRLTALSSGNRHREGAEFQHDSYDKDHKQILLSASFGMPGAIYPGFSVLKPVSLRSETHPIPDPQKAHVLQVRCATLEFQPTCALVFTPLLPAPWKSQR